eukprot:c25386_g1_i1 orf=401-1270(-)
MAVSHVSSFQVGSRNVTSKKIAIPNAAGELLVGVLNDTGSDELIVFCHGFRSSKEISILTTIATPLLAMGLSTFRFDFSGNGESEGEFQYGNYWKEVEDLRSVVLHWVRQGRLMRAIVGHSKGGNAALLYASKYQDVCRVVNISGRLALERGMEKRLGENFSQQIEVVGFLDVKDKSGNVEYRVTKESLQERLNTNMKQAASAIPKDCRVLTVHGSEDAVVTVEDAYEFNKIIPNHTLQIVDGADHVFTNYQKELAALVIEFLKNNCENCSKDGKKVNLIRVNMISSRI